jgi:hypothetical protein
LQIPQTDRTTELRIRAVLTGSASDLRFERMAKG